MRLILPIVLATGAFSLHAQLEFDAVKRGRDAFTTFGCIECHVVAKDDNSLKTGPSLYGLFLTDPRERETSDKETGERRKVKADKRYFVESVRQSWNELAVAERGPDKGSAYLPNMPQYTRDVVTDIDVESIWHYLRTLADEGHAGPATVMLKGNQQDKAKDLLAINGEIPVTSRTRVYRAPLMRTSGRALHVGLTNGMSYTFDPRMLSVRRVWSGGFLNMQPERSGRGNGPSRVGNGGNTFLESEPVLAPLTAAGQVVDFEFKDQDVRDHGAIERHVWDDSDFSEDLANLDAEFLGHSLASASAHPTFHFRVGKNTLSKTINITDDGRIEITVHGRVRETQRFKVRGDGLTRVTAKGGTLTDGVWTLEKTSGKKSQTLTARLDGGLVARPRVARGEDWSPQPLVVSPNKSGRNQLELPAGYSYEMWEPPKDLYGRNQLFEPTGIAVAKDGTIVVATRAAGIWRIRDEKWTLFAEGTYECLGVWIEDDTGDTFVVAQKPELTRVSDTDGDGRADRFETVCDDYGFHANYHEYTHGPVRDKKGNYYFTLNLSHGGSERVSWRAGGPFMGSMGGYRGWACRVTPSGKFEPFANGLRSPAGLGIDPEGRLWYAENQGEYVGSSKVVPLEKGKFYGHLSGLITLPGMKPDSEELKFEHWKDKIRKGAVWLPHGKLANSPGHPVWDLTGGKFGSYQRQMFIGDQTLSTLLRVKTERVRGADQGSVVVFGHGLASGVMRPVFLPDGSLLVGQTGRGWGARGGQQGSLQRIVWDGKTVAADISHVSAAPTGFTVHLTRPLDPALSDEDAAAKFKVQSWFYTNTKRYGSPEHERRDVGLDSVKVASDRRSVLLNITDFGKEGNGVDRLYFIRIPETKGLFGDAQAWNNLEAYFTLRAIP